MATYVELRNLFHHGDLRNKVEIACIIVAEEIRTEVDTIDNHANRVIWARQTFEDSRNQAAKMMMAILAANKDATTTQILAASDTAIQTQVGAAVNLFADGS